MSYYGFGLKEKYRYCLRSNLKSSNVVSISIGSKKVSCQDHCQVVSEWFQDFTEENMMRLRHQRETEQTDGVDEEDRGDHEVVAEPPHQPSADHLHQQS